MSLYHSFLKEFLLYYSYYCHVIAWNWSNNDAWTMMKLFSLHESDQSTKTGRFLSTKDPNAANMCSKSRAKSAAWYIKDPLF